MGQSAIEKNPDLGDGLEVLAREGFSGAAVLLARLALHRNNKIGFVNTWPLLNDNEYAIKELFSGNNSLRNNETLEWTKALLTEVSAPKYAFKFLKDRSAFAEH